MPVLEVTVEHVAQLKPSQLQHLLGRLLHAEARAHEIPGSAIHSTDPLRISVPDGGQDARISWRGGPERSAYCPSRLTLFQAKATEMPRSQCRAAVLHKRGDREQVLPLINEALHEGGAYVIVCTKPSEGAAYEERIAGIRDGLKDGGFVDADATPVDFYDANKLRDWINQYPPVAQWLLEQTWGVRLRGLWSWEKWSGDHDITGTSFESDEAVEQQLSALRDLVNRPKSVGRVTGLSGLGKTRLAFEALRPPDTEDPARKALSDSVLYINGQDHSAEVLEVAQSLVDNSLQALIVVDDCETRLHHRLERLVKHRDSKLSLLTLDHDVDAWTDGKAIVVRRATDEIIEKILKQSHPALGPSELKRIVLFAQGFPRIAALLADARLSGDANVGLLTNDELVRKMLWGHRPPDAEALRVVTICSLFSSLGVEEEAAPQLSYAAGLCGVSADRFYEFMSYFRTRQIIQKRGRYIQVTPLPLALRLAADWWRAQNKRRVREIFGEATPAGLLEAMCDQMRVLDALPEAQEIVSDLCGYNGPFGQAEVLNTESGSRCFRSLAEVNPGAALSALSRAFGEMPKDELLKVGPGRRDIVWALEKLVFPREQFSAAARLLLRFAEAENEHWGNNATAQFLQLFQLYLSGTEMEPDGRFALIDQIIREGDTRRKLALDALDRCLQTHHFTRSGGAEEQGTRPAFRDWRPKTLGDQRDYFRAALCRLIDVAMEFPQDRERVRGALANSLRGLIEHGLIKDVSNAVDRLLEMEHDAFVWPGAIESINQVLLYSRDSMPEDYKREVEDLLSRLLPRTLRGRVSLFVSNVPFSMEYGDLDEEEEHGARSARQARALAEECASDAGRFNELLPELLHGEQRLFYPFGFRLGEVFPDPAKLIETALSLLQDGAANPSIFGAFLAGLNNRDRRLVTTTLDRIAEHEPLSKHLPYLTSLLPLSDDEIDRLVQALRRGAFPVRSLRVFGFGRVLDSLSPESVNRLLNAALEHEAEGAWVALDLASMYSHGSTERRRVLGGTLESVVCRPGILGTPSKLLGALDTHHFEVAARWLLEHGNNKLNVARGLAEEFVRVSNAKKFPHSIDHVFREVGRALVEHFPDLVLSVWGRAITRGSELTRFHLQNMIGRGMGRDEQPLLLRFPEDTLLRWCQENPESAPEFIASSLPPLVESDGRFDWHPLLEIVVGRHGDVSGVLAALARNIHTFTWAGSVVPYYERYLAPLEKWLAHPTEQVRAWAERNRHQLIEQIRAERIREEEEKLRGYR